MNAINTSGLPPIPASDRTASPASPAARARLGLASPANRGQRDAMRSLGLEGDTSNEAVARGLEGVFLSMLTKQLRSSIEGGLFGKGPGSDVYEGMFDRALGESMAQGRGTGLREAILATLPPQDARGAESGTPSLASVAGSGAGASPATTPVAQPDVGNDDSESARAGSEIDFDAASALLAHRLASGKSDDS